MYERMLWRQSFCKDVAVRKIMLNNGVLRGTKYDGKEVYLVDFPPDENPTIGGIGVYVSTDTMEDYEGMYLNEAA